MLYLKKGTDHIQLAGFYFSYPDIIRDSSGFGRFGLQASVESAFLKKETWDGVHDDRKCGWLALGSRNFEGTLEAHTLGPKLVLQPKSEEKSPRVSLGFGACN